MRLPTTADCLKLYKKYQTPRSVLIHLTQVTTIAVKLATVKLQAGETVNVALVKAAALLHDLVRTPAQRVLLPVDLAKLSHAEINYRLLLPIYPEVAEIIRTHSLMVILKTPTPFKSVEEKIVYYADKRVDRQMIVSISERLTLGWERWPLNGQSDQTIALTQALQQLEQELFSNINLKPTDIK